jgi:hypothetical protein
VSIASKVRVQGDQIGRIFNIWLLFTWVFLKFCLNKKFQNTVCCTCIQKHFDATLLDFQFELLQFGYSFGYISENWAILFQTSGHTDRVPQIRNRKCKCYFKAPHNTA